MCSTLFFTFLWRCFARLQGETSRFYGRNVVWVLAHFFFSWQAATHFPLTLVAASISHFLAAVTKFPCCSSNKKKCLLFLSLTLDLCRPFSRWASLACRLISLFLCLSLVLYSKLWTWRWIYCKLNTFKTTRIQKQLPLSVFVFIDSLVFSALPDADGYSISRQNNLELYLGCHTCWLSHFTLGCLWCRLMGGRADRHTVTWLKTFLGWVDYHIFLPMVLRCARFARESFTIMLLI